MTVQLGRREDVSGLLSGLPLAPDSCYLRRVFDETLCFRSCSFVSSHSRDPGEENSPSVVGRVGLGPVSDLTGPRDRRVIRHQKPLVPPKPLFFYSLTSTFYPETLEDRDPRSSDEETVMYYRNPKSRTLWTKLRDKTENHTPVTGSLQRSYFNLLFPKSPYVLCLLRS